MLNPQITTAPAKNVGPSNDVAAKSTSPTGDPFGAVLARQIEDKNSSGTQTAKPSDSKSKSDTEKSKDTAANQDASATTAPAPAPAPDASTLASMLLGTVKPVTAQPAPKTQDKTAPDAPTADAAAMVGGMPGVQIPVQAKTPVIDNGKSSHAIGSSAKGLTAIAPTRDTSPATLKADAALQAAPKAVTEQFKSAELSAHLASAKPADPALALTQPTGTLIAATMPPDKAANPAVNTTIAAPVGSSAWPAEFAQKVSWVSTQQNQTAELHLNPPDLGPMTVVLSVSDNQATAVFSSPHSAVRDAIENAMPRLRESMAENGISLGNTSVNDQSPRDPGFADQRSGGGSRSSSGIDADGAAAPAASLPTMPTRRHNGMVDTFA